MNNGGNHFLMFLAVFIAAALLLLVGKVFIVMLCYGMLNCYFTVISVKVKLLSSTTLKHGMFFLSLLPGYW